MQHWYEQGIWNEVPPTKALRQWPQLTSGQPSAGITPLHSGVASTMNPEAHWMPSFSMSMTAEPHPEQHSNVELPYAIRYPYAKGAGWGAFPLTDPSLPSGDKGIWDNGHSYMSPPGFAPMSAGPTGLRRWPAFSQNRIKQMYASPVARRSYEPQEVLSVPRGPPRKPKRSGHALWVGNLPASLSIVGAKDYFSKGAIRDIESLFLMSHTNCAFVNYRTMQACKAAQFRFHGSMLGGKPLVCRIRVDTPRNGGKLSSSPPHSPSSARNFEKLDTVKTVDSNIDATIVGTSMLWSTSPPSPLSLVAKLRVPEKFIILKSLTVADLEASVRQKTWTTQLQNEALLDNALDESEKVYLIFSVNKSGEYFGYAQMVRPALDGRVEATVDKENCRDGHSHGSRLTPATSTAPKGRIVDDSARGVLFWEAILWDDKNDKEMIQEKSEKGPDVDNAGKAYAIEWLSTRRLPFHRTRGLRNPWNQHREIKIARDGTEIEPSVGKRLLGLFEVGHNPIFFDKATH